MSKYNEKHLDKYREIIDDNAGLVKYVAEAFKVSRVTIYEWQKKYPEFKTLFEDAVEATLDIAEHQLMKNIKEGRETSLIFFLKCKGKPRGYIDRDYEGEKKFTKEALKEATIEMKEATNA